MTEKDYDTFFEGFKSTNDRSLWEAPKLRNEPKTPTLPKHSLIDTKPKRQTLSYSPVFGSGTRKPTFPNIPSYGGGAKIQTSPYRPSTTNEANIQLLPGKPMTDGELKFQPLQYIPEKDAGTGLIKYASTAPQNIQVRNASQNSGESWWDKAWDEIKEPWEDRKNLLDELTKMYGDLSPEAKSAMKTILNPRADKNSREAAGKVLENEIMRIHYGRNQYNVDLPKTKDEAEAWGWEKDDLVNCHVFTGPRDKKRLKYVSPYDEKREIIVGSDADWNVISADEDEGTYARIYGSHISL